MNKIVTPQSEFTLLWPLIVTALTVSGILGCAEGPLWRTGYLSPWARQKWADEEQVTKTLFAQRQQLRQIVDAAKDSGEAQQMEASQYLAEIVQKDPILLMRIEATGLLAELPNDTSARALQLASNDPQPDVRLAAVKAWQRRGDEAALQALTSMLNRESDFDVRLRVVDALGGFNHPHAAQRLARVLSDPDPAMQVKVAESLGQITGENFGTDIQAWERFVTDTFGGNTTNTAATASYNSDQQ